MELNELYDPVTGEASEGTPELNGTTTVTQAALSEHPFMWALDSWLFAGPDAHLSTQRYAQGQQVSQLNVHAYRIEATTAGTMHLRRGM